MSLVAVFSRRDPKSVTTINTPVFSLENILDFKDKVDVLILCGGSKMIYLFKDQNLRAFSYSR